jgi:hypothetical protein
MSEQDCADLRLHSRFDLRKRARAFPQGLTCKAFIQSIPGGIERRFAQLGPTPTAFAGGAALTASL